VNRADTATRKITTGIVVAVGLFAGGDSYSHIFHLAREHHQDVMSAALVPLAGDGLVVAASATMLAAARNGKPVPLRARLMMLGGIGATIAANVAYGLPQGATGAFLSVWAVAAYIGCMELLTWMRENLGMQPRKTARTASAAPSASASGSADADAPEDELKDRRERRTRQPVADLLRAAEAAFTDRTAVPSLRDIQGAMSIGQARAQIVQGHLKSLQAATG
jgi:Protein of unknown function (DUF2637)